jgi:transposase-like protein
MSLRQRLLPGLAKGAELSETTVGNWVRAYREEHAGDEPLPLSERATLRELERKNRGLEVETCS